MSTIAHSPATVHGVRHRGGFHPVALAASWDEVRRVHRQRGVRRLGEVVIDRGYVPVAAERTPPLRLAVLMASYTGRPGAVLPTILFS
jgi:hypothetical protein